MKWLLAFCNTEKKVASCGPICRPFYRKILVNNAKPKIIPRMTALYAKQKAPNGYSGLFLREIITDDNVTRTAQICLKLLQFDEHMAMLRCGSDPVNAS